MFKEIEYGGKKPEVRALARKRLALKNKLRYHNNKAHDLEAVQIPEIEKKLKEMLEQIKQSK